MQSNIRVISKGYRVGEETLYHIERRGWLFWHDAGYVWAKTPQEALELAGAEAWVE